jgi:acyl-CoA synthetase (AMP-forming)/AMP-acid ligase II
MNDRGELLARGQTGEVVARGLNITPGYENNPTANQAAFTNGWFRTGDLGRFDQDGYLFLAGRLKEIINRGGEKISPREIDEVLLDHPGVAQALTFAMPDLRLGEEIAAAVVPRKGAPVTELDLMQFAAGRLADFKVPRRIVILEQIPTGPTGKPQRIGLAKKLGLDNPAATATAPATAATAARALTASETLLAARPCARRTTSSNVAGTQFSRRKSSPASVTRRAKS